MSEVEYYMCPTCENDVRVGSKGCPHCIRDARKKRLVKKVGAQRRSWEEDESVSGLGLPDEDFDYDNFVKREFGSKACDRVGIHPVWWWTAVGLVVAMVMMIAWGYF